MITAYRIPEDLPLSKKFEKIIQIKEVSVDHWSERFVEAGKAIRSNISFDSFLESFSDHHPIEFFLIKDFQSEMFYGKVVIKFDVNDTYYRYNIDLSLCDFNKIKHNLKLVEV